MHLPLVLCVKTTITAIIMSPLLSFVLCTPKFNHTLSTPSSPTQHYKQTTSMFVNYNYSNHNVGDVTVSQRIGKFTLYTADREQHWKVTTITPVIKSMAYALGQVGAITPRPTRFKENGSLIICLQCLEGVGGWVGTLRIKFSFR